MKITFVIYSMQSGGAERVLSIMANYWAQKSETVTIITLDGSKSTSFYELDSRIQQVSLDVAAVSSGFFSAIKNNIQRIALLRKAIRAQAADVVISFMTETNVLTLLSSFRLSIPVVVTEHTDPVTAPLGSFWSMLRKLSYTLASQVIVLNKRAYNYFSKHTRAKIEIIPNPVQINLNDVRALPELFDTGGFRVVSMGRLSAEKRFDLLINAFSKLAKKHPEWVLIILGEGPEREALEKICSNLGLANRVVMPGAVSLPHNILKECHIFVMSSDIEGFPMALCEAMACGLPVITTEYHEDVKDIVTHGSDGIIVPRNDPDKLAAAVDMLIQDREMRDFLSSNARESASRFSVDVVMHRWSNLIEGIRLENLPG